MYEVLIQRRHVGCENLKRVSVCRRQAPLCVLEEVPLRVELSELFELRGDTDERGTQVLSV